MMNDRDSDRLVNDNEQMVKALLEGCVDVTTADHRLVLVYARSTERDNAKRALESWREAWS